MLIGEALDTIWTLGWAFLAWLALVSLAATLALHAALALTRAVVHAARGTARPRRSAVPEYTDPTAQTAKEARP
ncbi:hypothetical protein ACIQNG_25530 [Streptomyces sp. NPDC091377]|uniref:hypothetical protein n=1 Tax=Streptomyces sp. NPDC091377 TaxID=3365995 RepID=UPI00381F0664